jgi:peptidoglycan/xylan/chitin deacetylase (PgdA/CDA1 family)
MPATTELRRPMLNSVLTEAAKSGILGTMRALGVFSRIRDSEWRSTRFLVLCYHGISQADEHEAARDLFMPATIFRQRLQMLRDGGYQVISLREGLDRLAAGTLPPRSVAITFDDGFVDFYRVAHPILREFGFPATVYVSTAYAELQLPVFPPILRYILWKAKGQKLNTQGVIPSRTTLRTCTATERARALNEILRDLAITGVSDPFACDEFAADLAGRLGVDYPQIRAQRLFHLMNVDEIRTISDQLIDIQLHTHRHVQPRDYAQFAQEIADNRVALTRAGVAADTLVHFCYPSGETRPELPAWLRDQRIRSATTCVPDIVDASCDPLLLPRFIDTQDVTPRKFEAWLCGAATLLPRRPLKRVDRAAPRRQFHSSSHVEFHK